MAEEYAQINGQDFRVFRDPQGDVAFVAPIDGNGAIVGPPVPAKAAGPGAALAGETPAGGGAEVLAQASQPVTADQPVKSDPFPGGIAPAAAAPPAADIASGDAFTADQFPQQVPTAVTQPAPTAVNQAAEPTWQGAAADPREAMYQRWLQSPEGQAWQKRQEDTTDPESCVGQFYVKGADEDGDGRKERTYGLVVGTEETGDGSVALACVEFRGRPARWFPSDVQLIERKQ